jgi:hypothetical protein
MENKSLNNRKKRSRFNTQDTDPAPVADWVRRRLETQTTHQIKAWAKAQYKDAYEVMRRYGSDIKTETAQKEYDSAKQHRRWINQIRRALEVAQQARRAAPLWRRTKPGAWGHEVQAYQSRQANDHGDSRHP